MKAEIQGGTMRFTAITIENFKNVEYGKLSFINKRLPDGPSILALYGQNGSGKSALVDCMNIFKYIHRGWRIPNSYAQFVRAGAKAARISYELEGEDANGLAFQSVYEIEFEAKSGNDDIDQVMADYGINKAYWTDFNDNDLERAANTKIRVLSETLKHKSSNDKRFRIIFESSTCKPTEPKSLFSSKSAREAWETGCAIIGFFLKHEDGSSALNYYGNWHESEEEGYNYTLPKAFCDLRDAAQDIQYFASCRLFVATTKEIESIESGSLPIFYDHQAFPKRAQNGITFDREKTHFEEALTIPTPTSYAYRISTDADNPSDVRHSAAARVVGTLDGANEVLKRIVPGLTLSLHLIPKEQDMFSAYVQATHGDSVLPLSCESRGIQKIVSITWLLIGVYNYSTFTAVIDELDAGVFEFLLGEILDIIAEEGQGQLVFTSHNLRPLEVLDKGYIAFSTTNPRNRYIRLKNVKTTNNLRDFYYRSILLGGQEESVYDPCTEGDIRLAFIKAGRANGNR